MPEERHDDDRNIVLQDIQDAADASEISAQEVVQNIQEAFELTGGQKEMAGQRGNA
jgi:hypothetical protein